MEFFSIILLSLSALVIASVVFPLALRIARKYNIMDNPDARKLQKQPVPVFGGIVVVLGMIIPLLTYAIYYHVGELGYPIMAILALWIIGVTDDIKNVSAYIRFILEFMIVWVLIWHPNTPDTGYMINNLFGLFGRHEISVYTAIPLTLIAGVGIINAINLIDGVDGYSSGFGIVANLFFSIIFIICQDTTMAIFSLVAAAALIPFYIHNVFGTTSKMFIGDGGSLVIGFILMYNVFSVLSHNSSCVELESQGISLVALSLAILNIPVFDTVRVMCARIFSGVSPFTPDKTHLHHLFIDLGFTHAQTSTTIISINILIVLLWYLVYRLGASINLQFFIVVLLGIFTTTIFYYATRHYLNKKSTNN